MKELNQKLLLLTVMTACAFVGLSQSLQDTWRKRVNENGQTLNQEYYYRLTDIMDAWMEDANWVDKILDIKVVTIVQDAKRSYFIKFDTQNCSGHFYARYDNIDWERGEYFFMQKPYPIEFVQASATRDARQQEDWEGIVKTVENDLESTYSPIYNSQLQTEKHPGLIDKLKKEWERFEAFALPKYEFRSGFDKSSYSYEAFTTSTIEGMKDRWKEQQGDLSRVANMEGNNKFQEGDYNEAKSYYSRAIVYDSTSVGAYFGRAESKFNLKDWEGAIEDYTKVVRFNDSNYSSAISKLETAKFNLEHMDGTFEDFYDNGNVLRRYSRKDNLMHGVTAIYTEDGKEVAGGDWNMGTQIGKWKMLMDSARNWVLSPNDANSVVEFNFSEKGNYISIAIEYDLNGIKIGQAKYRRNDRGTLIEDGGAKEYYANGNIKSEGKYEGGFKTGEWKELDENGQEKAIAKYDQGELTYYITVAEIEQQKIYLIKTKIIRAHKNFKERTSGLFRNSNVYATSENVILKKAAILHEHYYSQVQTTNDYTRLVVIKTVLDRLMKRLKELPGEDTTFLEMKLKFAKKPEKIRKALGI